jgi:hypothetical protein
MHRMPCWVRIRSTEPPADAGRAGRQVFVEYVMLAGVNDAPATAHELGALLTASPHTLLVNLIPWNPVFSPGMAFAAPDPARVAAFGVILREQYGLFTTVRQEMGQARPTAVLPRQLWRSVSGLDTALLRGLHIGLELGCAQHILTAGGGLSLRRAPARLHSPCLPLCAVLCHALLRHELALPAQDARPADLHARAACNWGSALGPGHFRGVRPAGHRAWRWRRRLQQQPRGRPRRHRGAGQAACCDAGGLRVKWSQDNWLMFSCLCL